MSKIKFVTDSAADIPRQYVQQYAIQVLPFPIALEQGEIQDGVDYPPEEFYPLLKVQSKIPTHAQLVPYQFEEVYEQAWKEGFDAVIYTAINFKGSATGSNALLAQKSFFAAHPEAVGKFEIEVIDSKTYTYNYGYAVVEAARAAQDGSLTAAQAVAMIRDWLDHAKILFTCFDLSFARKSGRISAAAAIMGGVMGICPVMSFPNGGSIVLAKPRGGRRAMKEIVRMMCEEMEPGTPYLVINAALEDKNREILEACEEAVGYPPVEVFRIGCVIAVNAGPELVGVVFRTRK